MYAVGGKFSLVITDRNRHVRDFLQREFAVAGYRVQAVADGRDVLEMIERGNLPDLLVLDPDIPYADGPALLERLSGCVPPLVVVIHCFSTGHIGHLLRGERVAMVEKSGSTDHLKTVVAEMLKKFYPRRFQDCETPAGEEKNGQESLNGE